MDHESPRASAALKLAGAAGSRSSTSRAPTSPRLLSLGAASLLVWSSVGCAGAPEDGDGPVGSAEQRALTANALTANALTANALTANHLTVGALTANPLTADALTTNPLTAEALGDPQARSVLKYLVSCALPAQSELAITVDGIAYTFDGQLGLAESWGEPGGACDATCRRWVSSCILSRLNFKGETVPLSLRGPHPALVATAAERADFSIDEATRYGDVFAAPQLRYACLAPGQTGMVRSCGPALSDCPWVVVGACADVCEGSTRQGAFERCHDRARSALTGRYPRGTMTFLEAATVYLEP